MNPALGRFEYNRFSMAEFTGALSNMMGRPVLNMTDLPGRFDIVLRGSPDDFPGVRTGVASPQGDSAASSVFAGMQDLGLKLESRKVPVEHLLIDHVEKVPTEN